MNILTKAVRGTQDILPPRSDERRCVEDAMFDVARLYGFSEIRTPIFEHTSLFDRAVGESTDVVQKEMYTFKDKGGRLLTLKPEGTAGVVRAAVEHGLFNQSLPLKLVYLTPCYRYEKPQSGRYREFYQFGLECFGSASPVADAEIICAALAIFEELKIRNLSLEINSIGCRNCRSGYYKALKDYFLNYREELCEDCQNRLERNPMRIIDCKNTNCRKIAKNAPSILNYLCEECKNHFELLKSYLDNAGVVYKVNPEIVRGLDYYTRTVFEFVAADDENRNVVCGGGGRYDNLVEEIGGPSMPAVGFGIGMERLLLLMENQKITVASRPTCDIFIVALDEKSLCRAVSLVKSLRSIHAFAELDILERSLRAQLKYANKIGARFSLVLGESELKVNVAKIKNMITGQQFDIRLDDNFLSDFNSIKNL